MNRKSIVMILIENEAKRSVIPEPVPGKTTKLNSNYRRKKNRPNRSCIDGVVVGNRDQSVAVVSISGDPALGFRENTPWVFESWARSIFFQSFIETRNRGPGEACETQLTVMLASSSTGGGGHYQSMSCPINLCLRMTGLPLKTSHLRLQHI